MNNTFQLQASRMLLLPTGVRSPQPTGHASGYESESPQPRSASAFPIPVAISLPQQLYSSEPWGAHGGFQSTAMIPTAPWVLDRASQGSSWGADGFRFPIAAEQQGWNQPSSYMPGYQGSLPFTAYAPVGFPEPGPDQSQPMQLTVGYPVPAAHPSLAAQSRAASSIVAAPQRRLPQVSFRIFIS